MKIALIVFLVLSVVQACAQQNKGNTETVQQPASPEHVFVASDAAEMVDVSKTNIGPYRVADGASVEFNLNSSGRWIQTDTDWVWELEIEAESASSLNFGFDNVRLSEHAQLSILNSAGDAQGGHFDARQNKSHGQLWTGMVNGRFAVIRLSMPHDERDQNTLTLKKINRGR